MKIRAKVENAERPGELLEIEFEIPDDSPEAQVLRESALGTYSAVGPAHQPNPLQRINRDAGRWPRGGAAQWREG